MGTEDGAKGHPKAGKGGSKGTGQAAVKAVKVAVGKGVKAVKEHASRKPPMKARDDAYTIEDGKPARFVPTLMRAARLARLYYFGDQKVRARVLLGAMLVLCACTTGLMVVFSYVQRDMSTALSGKDVSGFYAAIRKYIGVIIVAAPLFAIYHYVQSLVALEWRLWLTRLLVHKYFDNHAYFALKAEGSMDNPDQRICDDVRNFVESCNSVLLAVVQKLLSMGAFFGVLYGISPELLLFCFMYSIAGTVITTKFFGSRLMSLHFQALRREADLRFGLVRAREHAESIALYRGAVREARAARNALAQVAEVLLRRVAWSRNLALFTNAYEFATFCLPSLIIAPRYFAGQVEFGVVTQAGYAFRTVQGALNLIVNRFEQLSGLAAESERLERLLALLEGLDMGPGRAGENKLNGDGGMRRGNGKDNVTQEIELTIKGEADAVSITPSSSIKRQELALDAGRGLLCLKGVGVSTPISGRKLWSNLSMELRDGDSVLVIGPSGCGKSSLLRAVAGVWTTGEGEIAAPPQEDTLFLPQSPYMPLGSLRAQLLFPASEPEIEDSGQYMNGKADHAYEHIASFDDEELLTALDAAGLGELPERFFQEGGMNARVEWADVLSAGEQQRVAFARLFLRRPACAFLDEATSALDERGESAMYELLKRHVRGFVSVGHRSTLMRYHSHVLRFVPGQEVNGDRPGQTGGSGIGGDVNGGSAGSWVLERMEDYARRSDGSLHLS